MKTEATVSLVTSTAGTPQVFRSGFADLSVTQLYALLKLRVDVFVVEQDCAYPELDGHDADPATTHYWVEVNAPDPVAATLRVLRGSDGFRIGRVATAIGHRGQGHARCLMRAAIGDVGDAETRLEAQSHLQDWYAGFGFEVDGPEYLEDGIPHVPMRRTGGVE